MKKALLIFLAGMFLGWLTVPILRAESSSEIRHYIDALRRIITIMEKIQVTSQETADNTKAIKEKLGAK